MTKQEALLKEQIEKTGILVGDDQFNNMLKQVYAGNPNFTNEAGIFDQAVLEEYVANLKATSADDQTNVLLSFAKQVIESRGSVSQEQLQRVKNAGFSDEQLVEVIGHIALNSFTNYFNEAFDIEIDFPQVELT